LWWIDCVRHVCGGKHRTGEAYIQLLETTGWGKPHPAIEKLSVPEVIIVAYCRWLGLVGMRSLHLWVDPPDGKEATDLFFAVEIENTRIRYLGSAIAAELVLKSFGEHGPLSIPLQYPATENAGVQAGPEKPVLFGRR